MPQTAESVPAAVEALSSALGGLPSNLSPANLTLLSSLLSEFADSLSPSLPTLAAAQQEALLSNTTFLTAQLDELGAVTAQIPLSDLQKGSPADLQALILIGTTRYDVFTFWAPDIWAITWLFGVAALLKVAVVALVNRKAVKRTAVVQRGKGVVDDIELSRAALTKPAKAALGHILNLVVSIIAIILQLLAYRLFVLPGGPIRMSDFRFLMAAIKALLIGYGSDLLFGDLRPEIFLHHFMTFILLFVGQLAAFQTKSPKFFRFAQWILLHATLEQSTYAAMAAYHLYNYLRVQDHRLGMQSSLLRSAYAMLRFTRWITFPQKVVPAAFALAWLGMMWDDIDSMPWGRAWIGICTSFVMLLLILQVKFCDDIFPLSAYIGYKLHGGPLPPRQGPVMRFLTGSCRGRHRSAAPVLAAAQTEAGLGTSLDSTGSPFATHALYDGPPTTLGSMQKEQEEASMQPVSAVDPGWALTQPDEDTRTPSWRSALTSRPSSLFSFRPLSLSYQDDPGSPLRTFRRSLGGYSQVSGGTESEVGSQADLLRQPQADSALSGGGQP
ncbi:uncharacterized protein JCM10292_001244 [Rhodotorula paludigena]|uniref:uncharacterized protein n=1 Tax=Rhodotorula paludigena TaxID=86838 RepID=UPI00318101BB